MFSPQLVGSFAQPVARDWIAPAHRSRGSPERSHEPKRLPDKDLKILCTLDLFGGPAESLLLESVPRGTLVQRQEGWGSKVRDMRLREDGWDGVRWDERIASMITPGDPRRVSRRRRFES